MYAFLARLRFGFGLAVNALSAAVVIAPLLVAGCTETMADDTALPATSSGEGGGGPATAQASTSTTSASSSSSGAGSGGAGAGGNGGSAGSGGQSNEDAAAHVDASDAASIDERPASMDSSSSADARDATIEGGTVGEAGAEGGPPVDGGKSVPQQGLILHLSLDDNPPTSALDDATGTKGMAQNCVSVPGKVGLAFRFAGTNPMNPAMSSLIQFPDRPALDPTSAITVGAWIRPRTGDMGGGPRILQKGYDNTDQDTQYRFIINGNSIALLLFNQGNTAVISGPLPPLNEWHHVAVTWDSASGMGIVYVDGVNKKQTTYRGAIGVSTTPLFIGTKHDNDKVTNWDGDLDEIVLYNRALGAAEVQQLATP